MGLIGFIIRVSIMILLLSMAYNAVEGLFTDDVDSRRVSAYALKDMGFCKNGILDVETNQILCIQKLLTVNYSCNNIECKKELIDNF